MFIPWIENAQIVIVCCLIKCECMVGNKKCSEIVPDYQKDASIFFQ